MSATTRPIEFAIEWLQADDQTQAASLMPTTERAHAWLAHHGIDAVMQRVNAMSSDRPLSEMLQDLLEQDGGPARGEPPSAAQLTSGATAEFAVEFEDNPNDADSKIVTITPLTDGARGWMDLHGDDLVWRVNREMRQGERLDQVHQRLLEQDLGPMSSGA